MQALNLPQYPLTIRENTGSQQIFDIIRKKYVALTPEEWVRQHIVHFLINSKAYPASLLAIEHSLKYNTMQKRCDIIAYNTSTKPVLLVECKAPSVSIDQYVFEQIAMYNTQLKVPFLLVTNGMQHYCCKIDFNENKYAFLEDIPAYKDMIT